MSLSVMIGGPERTFDSAVSLEAWLSERCQAIDNICAQIGVTQPFQQRPFTDVRRWITDQGGIQSVDEQSLAARVSQVYGPVACLRDDNYNLLRTMEKRIGADAALGALVAFDPQLYRRDETRVGLAKMARGTIEAVAFLGQLDAWQESIALHLSSIHQGATDRARIYDAQLRTQSDSMASLLRSAKESIDTWRSEMEARQATFDTDVRSHAEQMQSATEEAIRRAGDLDRFLNEAERKLTAKVALEAPINYWRKKSERHERAASSLRWSIASAVIAILLLFSGTVWVLYTWRPLADNGAGSVVAETGLRWTAMAFFIAIAFWLLRMLSRRFHSHQHLMEDAEERVVMIETFLSLASGKESSAADHMTQLLSTVFRPTSDGLVADDHNPTLPIQARS